MDKVLFFNFILKDCNDGIADRQSWLCRLVAMTDFGAEQSK